MLDKLTTRLTKYRMWDYSPMSGPYGQALAAALPGPAYGTTHPGSRRRPPSANLRRSRRRMQCASRRRNRP